ncbi:hypothetical protein DL93DRAFT_1591194 [Clavulina sp. PMI_390]|nr:hypothetical protein DL93DRAFT_1591194 [Clavulina sp. PMI_390]
MGNCFSISESEKESTPIAGRSGDAETEGERMTRANLSPSFPAATLFRNALAAVNAASDVFPPLKSATGGALWLVDEILKYKSFKSEWADFAEYIQYHVARIIFVAKEQGISSPEFRENLDDLDKVIQKIVTEVNIFLHQDHLNRVTVYMRHCDDVTQYKAMLDRALQKFNIQSTILTDSKMSAVLQDTDSLKEWASSTQNILRLLTQGQSEILNHLGAAEVHHLLQDLKKHLVDGASGRLTELCASGTRRRILCEITAFLEGQAKASEPSPRIFLLSGMAGAGKSIIARTCRQYFTDRQEFYIASFFFNRAYPERSVPTRSIAHLAAALCDSHPEVQHAMARALKKRCDLTSADLITQFNALIREPLSFLPPDSKSIIIIIDALDEADDSITTDITQWSTEEHLFDDFLKVLSEETTFLSPRVRILLTTRDQPSILSCFTGKPHVRVRHLHLDRESLEDVHKYAIIKFQNIAIKKRIAQWPSSEQVELFAQRSGALFIWARTALEWIEDSDKPVDELEQILSSQPPPEAADRLNSMYAMVISRLPWHRPSFPQRYRDTIGAVLCMRRPLTIIALANLLGENREDLRRTLERLMPILSGVSQCDEPVTVAHESVREYILMYASTRGVEAHFGIHPEYANGFLADRCIKLMDENISTSHGGQPEKNMQETPSFVSLVPTYLLGRVEDHAIYAIDFWHEHVALGPRSMGFYTKVGPLILRWMLSFLVKTVNPRRGRFTGELLKAQTDAGFFSIRDVPPDDPVLQFPIPLRIFIGNLDGLRNLVSYKDLRVAPAARREQLGLIIAGISLLYESERAQPIPTEAITDQLPEQPSISVNTILARAL